MIMNRKISVLRNVAAIVACLAVMTACGGGSSKASGDATASGGNGETKEVAKSGNNNKLEWSKHEYLSKLPEYKGVGAVKYADLQEYEKDGVLQYQYYRLTLEGVNYDEVKNYVLSVAPKSKEEDIKKGYEINTNYDEANQSAIKKFGFRYVEAFSDRKPTFNIFVYIYK
jgi:hypothetical protein